jgi:hypothetical protein
VILYGKMILNVLLTCVYQEFACFVSVARITSDSVVNLYSACNQFPWLTDRKGEKEKQWIIEKEKIGFTENQDMKHNI